MRIFLFLFLSSLCFAESPFGAQYFNFSQISPPANPSSGFNNLFFKNDNNLYMQNSSGTVTELFPLSAVPANRVAAGPVGGAAALPSFRALVSADFPAPFTPNGDNSTTLGTSGIRWQALYLALSLSVADLTYSSDLLNQASLVGTGTSLTISAGASSGDVGGNLNLKATAGANNTSSGLVQFLEPDGTVYATVDTNSGAGRMSFLSGSTSGQRGVRWYWDSTHYGQIAPNGTFGLVVDSEIGVYYELGATLANVINFTSGGSIDIQTVGGGLQVAEGTNAKQGVSTCNGTTEVTVANTSVTANSRIFLSPVNHSSPPILSPYESSKTASTSFGFKCGAADTTTTVNWEIFQPG